MDEVQRRLRLEGLFDAHAGAVRAYARRRIDATAADDTVAEVFATAWRRLDDVPEEALPWLLGCARRVIAHQHRRASRDTELLERLKPVAGGPETDGGKLAWALSTLSARDRELLLFDRVGRAGAHGGGRGAWCSRTALAVRLHRARKRLADALNRTGGSTRMDVTRSSTQEAL